MEFDLQAFSSIDGFLSRALSDTISYACYLAASTAWMEVERWNSEREAQQLSYPLARGLKLSSGTKTKMASCHLCLAHPQLIPPIFPCFSTQPPLLQSTPSHLPLPPSTRHSLQDNSFVTLTYVFPLAPSLTPS